MLNYINHLPKLMIFCKDNFACIMYTYFFDTLRDTQFRIVDKWSLESQTDPKSLSSSLHSF